MTDASLWGVAAILVFWAISQVISWFASALTADDEERLRILIGDPSSQAIVEMLAIVVAVRARVELMRAGRTAFSIRSNSDAALGAARRLSSPTWELNFLFARVSIQLENLDAAELTGERLADSQNVTAAIGSLWVKTEPATASQKRGGF